MAKVWKLCKRAGKYTEFFLTIPVLGCYFEMNFGQTLAPGSALSNSLRTKILAWTESSIIGESMVKFIWKHNLLTGLYGTFKIPSERLDFWCSKGKLWDSPKTSKLKDREVSQTGFQISHNTQLLCQASAKSVDDNFWLLEHFLRQWH